MSSRRHQNATDDSTWSVDSATARAARVTFEYLAASDLDVMSSASVLHRSLTLPSVISTPSSYAKRVQQAQSGPTQITQVGEGLQGAIFEHLGRALAMKKETPGNEGLPSNLRHEYNIHIAVEASFDRFAPLIDCRIYTPRLASFKPKSENQPFWNEYFQNVPVGYRQAAYAFMQWGAGVDGDDDEFVLGSYAYIEAGGKILAEQGLEGNFSIEDFR
ncbi:Fc.00g022270.m01.CDS01 [Cosmosporella sp. VM-42]